MATHIKMRESCTLMGDKVLPGERQGGKVIPWGRTFAVGASSADGISETHAAALISAGFAIAMAQIVFDVPTGPYNPGEIGTFPEKEADLLVKAKKARPYKPTAS